MFQLLVSLSAYILCVYSALANVPSAYVKSHNISPLPQSIKTKLVPGQASLNKEWTRFLKDNQDVLRKKSNDPQSPKTDQFCSFIVQLDPDGSINIDSLKLAKHKKNYAYNLKVIEFLRNTSIQFTAKNPNKPMQLDFIYLSF
jgi:hypothetical protein